jgi:hypothetical protein
VSSKTINFLKEYGWPSQNFYVGKFGWSTTVREKYFFVKHLQLRNIGLDQALDSNEDIWI